MNIIEIKNLNFSYKDKIIFNNFSLNIKENKWTTIVGSNGSGKSTLIKLITGLLKPNDGEIIIDSSIINNINIKYIRSKMGVIFSNPDNHFIAETVEDDIAFTLENMQLKSNIIEDKVSFVAHLLNIESLLKCSPYDLSGGEKQLVALASIIVTEPKILILDEAFTMVDYSTKEKILKLLLKLKKELGLTIINITHDMEESIYGDNIVVMKDGEVLINDSNNKVYENEKILRKANLELPFMANLSLKLRYYGLVDDIVLDMDKLVNKLWK